VFELFPMQCEKMVEGMQMLGGSPISVVLLILLTVILGIGSFFLFNLLFKWLWNITLPEVFGLKEITFWQAFRLLVIFGLLIGGLGGHLGS